MGSRNGYTDELVESKGHAVQGPTILKTREHHAAIGDRFGVEVVPLGAARSTGRSCILVKALGRYILLDCGVDVTANVLHESMLPVASSAAAKSRKRKKVEDTTQQKAYYPNFGVLGAINKVSAVIVTHCHLDHSGALMYLTEYLNYDGPIFMTHATKRLCEALLEDNLNNLRTSPLFTQQSAKADMNDDQKPFLPTSQDLVSCLDKIRCVRYYEKFGIEGDDQLLFTLYPAGHVLGAAMASVIVCNELRAATPQASTMRVLYTGDFNHAFDRACGRCVVEGSKVDVLICETTFCSLIRTSRLFGEQKLLQTVHQCFQAATEALTDPFHGTLFETKKHSEHSTGGKILIPIGALGRLQELLIVLDSYLQQNGLEVPIYYASKLAKAIHEAMDDASTQTMSCPTRSLCSRLAPGAKDTGTFSHALRRALVWPHHYNDTSRKLESMKTPLIFLAPDENLEQGLSRVAFRAFCGSEFNAVVFPGRCFAGSLGYKVCNLSKKGSQTVRINRKPVKVACKIQVLDGYSNHTDAKGILDLVDRLQPSLAVLLHGTENSMVNFQQNLSKHYPNTSVVAPMLQEVIQYHK